VNSVKKLNLVLVVALSLVVAMLLAKGGVHGYGFSSGF
jgi:preprotein translocase subunit SecG